MARAFLLLWIVPVLLIGLVGPVNAAVVGLDNPGSQNYPRPDPMRSRALVLGPDEQVLSSAVLDSAGNFAYFGTETSPGRIVKVRAADNFRIDEVVLPAGEDSLLSAVIDSDAGFAYFGTGTSPGKVVKIDLSSFTRVGMLELDPGENLLTSAVIDADAGFAYFGTGTSPGQVVKVDLATFMRVGSVTLSAGMNDLSSAVIDTADGFAYFGTGTSPGQVARINLGSFAHDGTVVMQAGENLLTSAVIDLDDDVAIFGTGEIGAFGRAIKVDLDSFTRVDAVVLQEGETQLRSAVLNPANGSVYFGSRTGIGRVVRVDAENMERLGVLPLEDGESYLRSAVIDPVRGRVLFGTGDEGSPGRIVQLDVTPTPVLKRDVAITLEHFQSPIRSAVIDASNRFVYFSGSRHVPVGPNATTNAGTIYKFDLDKLSVVDIMEFDTGVEEADLVESFIDLSNGYAYFISSVVLGRIIKVDLSTFTRVDTLDIHTSQGYQLTSAVIDEAAGFAYLGNDSFGNPPGDGGKIVKIDLSTFTHVDTLTLEPGEINLDSAVIDPDAGFAYFATRTSPAKIIKVQLSDFTRVGVLELEPGEDQVYVSLIDTDDQAAYFATLTQPGRVVKVDLATFTRVGAVVGDNWEGDLTCGVLDTAANKAYFGRGTSDVGILMVVDLPTFTREEGLYLNAGEGGLTSAIFDPATNSTYFATQSFPASRIVQVVRGRSDLPEVAGTATGLLAQSESVFETAVIDPDARKIYLGSDSSPGRVTKFDLDLFEREASVPGLSGENRFNSPLLDPDGEFLYFGTFTSPGQVVKFRTSDFTRVAGLTFDSGENQVRAAVMDPSGEYAYYSVNVPFGSPGRIVKVRLSDFTRVDSLEMNPGETFQTAAVMAPDGSAAYFSLNTFPNGSIVKVQLSDFTRAGRIDLLAGESTVICGTVSPDGRFAYFGTATNPGIVVKIDLDTFQRAGAVKLVGAGINENQLRAAVMHPSGAMAYFSASPGGGSGPHIVAIETARFQRAGSTPLPGTSAYFGEAFDPVDDSVYLALPSFPGQLLKVMVDGSPTSQSGLLKGTRITLDEFSIIEEMGFHSHTASGNLRLAIYDDEEPKNLLWQSGELPNSASAEELIVPIGVGTPPFLTLDAGDYWLAWQVDTDAPVPSYSGGMMGHGFTFEQAFGPAPSSIPSSEVVVTDERWTQSILTDAPGPIGVTISGIPASTNQTVIEGGQITFSRSVTGLEASDFATDGTTITNLDGSGRHYTFDVTLTPGAGTRTLQLPADSTTDPLDDGNEESALVSILIDQAPPTASLAVNSDIVINDFITGTHTASDSGGSGLDRVELWMRPPNADWMMVDTLSGSSWSFIATSQQVGEIHFAAVAWDNAGNNSGIPTGDDPGDAMVLFNYFNNFPFSRTFEEDSELIFPMTEDRSITIALTGVTEPVSITVSRNVTDTAPAGLNAGDLIDEFLNINGDLKGATATVTWPYDPNNALGLSGPVSVVYQYEGEVPLNTYPVASGSNPLVIEGITSFSTWWAGPSDTPVGEVSDHMATW